MDDLRDQSLGIAEHIAAALGRPVARIVARQPCGGGCIHRAEIVTLADRTRWFLKSSRRAADMFEQERAGLEALRAAGILRIPTVVCQFRLGGDIDYLVLEAIDQARPPADFFERFGRQLAELHRSAVGAQFGWPTDNYLGSSPQAGGWHSDWVEFFGSKRLQPQIRMARNRGVATAELVRKMDRLLERLDQWLAAPFDPPSLLHGDLWSGNFLCDTGGQAVLIDPAVYYGRREAELAMPLLFGGFPPIFLDAYSETWPLETGWRDRVEIYQLYHLLNHLNLFGSGYLESCLSTLRRLV